MIMHCYGLSDFHRALSKAVLPRFFYPGKGCPHFFHVDVRRLARVPGQGKQQQPNLKPQDTPCRIKTVPAESWAVQVILYDALEIMILNASVGR